MLSDLRLHFGKWKLTHMFAWSCSMFAGRWNMFTSWWQEIPDSSWHVLCHRESGLFCHMKNQNYMNFKKYVASSPRSSENFRKKFQFLKLHMSCAISIFEIHWNSSNTFTGIAISNVLNLQAKIKKKTESSKTFSISSEDVGGKCRTILQDVTRSSNKSQECKHLSPG